MQKNNTELDVCSLRKRLIGFALSVTEHYNEHNVKEKRVIRQERPYEIQLAMFAAGLTNPVEACVVINKQDVPNEQSLMMLINKVISHNEIFNYVYIKKEDEIILNVIENEEDRKFLIFHDAAEKDIPKIIKFVNGFLSKELDNNLWNSELFDVYIVETEARYYINFLVSHIIADPGINTVLNIVFRQELNGTKIEFPQYSEYIKTIRDGRYNNPYTTQLSSFLKINEDNNPILDDLTKERTLMVAPSTCSLNNWDELLLECTFLIGTNILSKTNLKELVMKVSYNFRNALEPKYQRLVGDCHSYFFVYILADDDLERFMARNSEYLKLIKENAIECGYWTAVGDNIYKDIYDSTRVNINLVTGYYLSQNDVNDYLSKAKKLNEKVMRFKNLRIDAVLFKKKYYMYIL